MEIQDSYLRHGQSEGNVNRTFQSPTEKLTDLGKMQAIITGQRLAADPYPPELIVTSTLKRAKETTRVIRAFIGSIKVVQSALLDERRHPPEIEGRSFDDPEIAALISLYHTNLENPAWPSSRGESYWAFLRRASQWLSFREELLRLYPQKRILAVTSGGNIKAVKAQMSHPQLSAFTYFKYLDSRVDLFNCSISRFKRREDGLWKEVTWNDYSHLEGQPHLVG